MNMLIGAGEIFFILLYIMFFLMGSSGQIVNHLYLCFRHSCSFLYKSAAKGFLEEVFGKKLITPVIMVQPFLSIMFHYCLVWMLVRKLVTVALNVLLCQVYCYINAQLLIAEMSRNWHR